MAELAEKRQEKEKAQEISKVTPSRAVSPFQEMERFFEGVLPQGWLRPFHWERPWWRELPTPFEGKMPSVDVIDREDEVVVRAELPGVEKKDLEVSMSDNTVTIKGSTKREEEEEKGDYYRKEISTGMYARTIVLPAEVDSTKTKARFKDGMLELTLPKMEQAKRRSIEVE